MKKITLFILALCLAFFLVYGFKQPKLVYDQTFGKNPITDVLGTTARSSPSPDSFNHSNPVSKAVGSIKDSFQQSFDNLKNSLYQNLESGLSQVFSQSSPYSSSASANPSPSPGIQVVATPPPTSSTQRLTIIDVSKSNHIKISVTKGSVYYLEFRNTPPKYCLYLNSHKYPINDTQALAIEIYSNGTYPIYLNSCDLNDKNIGEIEVE